MKKHLVCSAFMVLALTSVFSTEGHAMGRSPSWETDTTSRRNPQLVLTEGSGGSIPIYRFQDSGNCRLGSLVTRHSKDGKLSCHPLSDYILRNLRSTWSSEFEHHGVPAETSYGCFPQFVSQSLITPSMVGQDIDYLHIGYRVPVVSHHLPAQMLNRILSFDWVVSRLDLAYEASLEQMREEIVGIVNRLDSGLMNSIVLSGAHIDAVNGEEVQVSFDRMRGAFPLYGHTRSRAAASFFDDISNGFAQPDFLSACQAVGGSESDLAVVSVYVRHVDLK